MFDEYDQEEKELSKLQIKKQQQKKLTLILLLLTAGVAYLFLVYLPQEKQKKELATRIQADVDRLQAVEPKDYSALLTTLQGYLLLANGTEWEQMVLNDKKEILNQGIEWLKLEKLRYAQELTEKTKKDAEEAAVREEKKNREKKLHWKRKAYNWADELMHGVIKTALEGGWKELVDKVFGGQEPETCIYGAQYTIHFPPACWEKLTNEQKYVNGIPSKENIKPGITLLDSNEELIFTNKKILEWEQKVLINPTRGELDSTSGKDNNALFYGAPGTGKTSITKRLCLRTNRFPMVEVKGSSFTPTFADNVAGLKPLQKFVYTVSDITWNLVDNFGFEREEGGEARYILFVDEANQVSNNAFTHDPSRLQFLKECMEGVNKEKQSKNLWIFATNYLEEIDKAVYRPGRLSNPLDFSWTLGDFYEHARRKGIYGQFPRHWTETAVLKKEDNEFVNKFSIKSFNELFLPFWKKFIAHPETQKDLPEIKPENSNEQQPAQPGIQLGEFFEFFWNLKESGQLHHFNGKWESPRTDKIEDIISVVRDTIDMRIDETNELLQKIGTAINEMGSGLQSATSSTIQLEIQDLQRQVADLQNKIR
ncbi:AAA family ATPase [endosymbiont GvMRE of Glomus versiforme]|uniref:AAA family ATPase n=1 Tax=endosymbiont GvMRE of Glomus versiforme TaxID=2039283 RepID=UPI000EEA5BCD|nr:AAA family ATPase [endosymbiont GvMRE of Glomus versiforme]RHZ35897.1 26S proteasome regulatory subunit 6B homolog-like [endosymbiont GvMRE of Glomus versiforme]